MKKNLQNLLIFLLVFAVRIKAQNIQVMMSPNPSPFISDWQQKTETIKLVITNSTQQVIVAKIKTELLDGSSSIIASTDASKMPEIEIGLGVTTFDASEVFPMQAIKYSGKGEKIAMQTGKIPEDNYQLCVSLTSPQTGQTIGTSSKQCKAFNIVAYQAPVLISPSNLKVLNENEAKGLMFRWTPICCKLPDPPPTYQLQIWEVLEGQTPIVAIRSNQPIVEKTLNNITQTQWPVEFAQPEAGKQYVWTVTAKDEEDRNLVDGNGFAEPFTFTINSNEKLVLDLLSPENGSKISSEDAKNIQFRWTPICCRTPPSHTYKLRVWELKNGQTAEQAVKNNKPILTNEGIKNTELSKINLWNEIQAYHKVDTPLRPVGTGSGGLPYRLIWIIEGIDEKGNVLAISEPNEISVQTSSVVCLCYPWPSDIRVEVTNTSAGVLSSSNVSNGGTVTVAAAQNINIPNFVIPCQTGCTPTISYSLYYPNGTTAYTGNTNAYQQGIFELLCDTGKYKLVISLKCGATSCSDYVIWINKPCPVTPSCVCQGWDKIKVNGTLYACGGNLAVPCSTAVSFSNSFTCNPNTPNCRANVWWKVIGPGGFTATGSSVSSLAGTFTPTTTGTYTISLFAVCGTDTCGSCNFKIVTTCATCTLCSQLTITTPMISYTGNSATILGSINSAGSPITKVVAILDAISVKNKSGFPIVIPNPNFEFSTGTQIGGIFNPVNFLSSLSGGRSNIVQSTFTTSMPSLGYTFAINDMTNKQIQKYRIKLIIFRADGTYCERYIFN